MSETKVAYKVGDIYVDGNGKEVRGYEPPVPEAEPEAEKQQDAREAHIADLRFMLDQTNENHETVLQSVREAAQRSIDDATRSVSAANAETEELKEQMKILRTENEKLKSEAKKNAKPAEAKPATDAINPSANPPIVPAQGNG